MKRYLTALIAAGGLIAWLAACGRSANLVAQERPAEKSPAFGSPVLPAPDEAFGGVVGRKASESKPDFPNGVTAPAGALVLDGKPMFVYANTNQDGEKYPKQRKDKTRIASASKLGPGKHTIVFDFVYDGGGLGKGGKGTLTVDGKKEAESRIEKTNPLDKFTLDESFDVGLDTGSPVIDDYDAKMPFKFTGTIQKIEIKLGSDSLPPAARAELQRNQRARALAAQ